MQGDCSPGERYGVRIQHRADLVSDRNAKLLGGSDYNGQSLLKLILRVIAERRPRVARGLRQRGWRVPRRCD